MWKFSWISIISVLFCTLIILVMFSPGKARHYIVESTETTVTENLDLEPEYHECYITETRRIGGQCVKIRGTFRGCVAGSLMEPFHQNCL